MMEKKAVHGMWPVLQDTLVYGCLTVENLRNTRAAGCQVPHTIYTRHLDVEASYHPVTLSVCPP